ncbi:MAG: glycosyltransferase family 4 protein [Acidimicrobiales bacterium]
MPDVRPATTASPKRILFVSWRDLANPMAGGSEILIHEMASGLGAKGYEVTLLCGGPVEQRQHYQVVRSGGEFSQYLLAPLRHRHFRDADLVVDVCNGMPFLTPLWHRGADVCLVNHVHTEQWRSRFNPVVAAAGRRFESTVMPFVHRKNLMVTISPSTHSGLLTIGIPESRIREIPQGTSAPPPLCDKSDTPLFVAAGRLVGYKRINLLLDMWEEVRERTGGRLVIIGDGPDRAALEARHVEGVTLTGFIPEAEKHRLMCQAWVLLHTASWEGWGLVITEAARRDTTAVGFDVPGVRDAISDGESGLLATGENDFKDHWVRLATDASLRDKMAATAARRAANLSWDRTVDAFEEVADEAYGRHARGRRAAGAGT